MCMSPSSQSSHTTDNFSRESESDYIHASWCVCPHRPHHLTQLIIFQESPKATMYVPLDSWCACHHRPCHITQMIIFQESPKATTYVPLDAHIAVPVVLLILVPLLDLLLQGSWISPAQHVNLHLVAVEQEGGHGRHPLTLGCLLGNKGGQG